MNTMAKRAWRTRATMTLCGLLVVVLTVAPLQAAPIAERDVIAAVETWVHAGTADARPDAIVERIEPHTVDGVTTAYIAHLSGGGYCICGADDGLLPVYLYNPHALYDPANPGCQMVLQEIDSRFERLHNARELPDIELEDYRAALDKRAVVWEDLIAGYVPSDRGGSRDRSDPDYMVLPLQSYWGQGSPYNDQCPELTPETPERDEHTKVGCIALSTAQVMHYWKWPNVGQGSNSQPYIWRWRDDWDGEPLAEDPGFRREGRLDYSDASLWMNGRWDGSMWWGYHEHHPDEVLFLGALDALWDRLNISQIPNEADFGATTYNWDIIRDVHENDAIDDGDQEVAKVCHHVGISLLNRWGVENTAISGNVEQALENNWRYHPDLVFTESDFDTIVDEIRWLRPVIMGGERAGGGGHQFVACGYNLSSVPEPQILFNMGWGGGSTAWYTLDDDYVFSTNQKTHHYIAPQNVVRFVEPGVTGGTGSPLDPHQGVAFALAAAPDEATLIFKAGTTHTISGTAAVIDKPITLKGYDVTIVNSEP